MHAEQGREQDPGENIVQRAAGERERAESRAGEPVFGDDPGHHGNAVIASATPSGTTVPVSEIAPTAFADPQILRRLNSYPESNM